MSWIPQGGWPADWSATERERATQLYTRLQSNKLAEILVHMAIYKAKYDLTYSSEQERWLEHFGLVTPAVSATPAATPTRPKREPQPIQPLQPQPTRQKKPYWELITSQNTQPPQQQQQPQPSPPHTPKAKPSAPAPYAPRKSYAGKSIKPHMVKKKSTVVTARPPTVKAPPSRIGTTPPATV